MGLKPVKEAAPKIRKALKTFEISAVATGIMLFGLYIISGIRWGSHQNVWLFTNSGFAQLVPDSGTPFSPGGFNFTTVFLIVHGWFYVLYLVTTFLLWSAMRWPFWKFFVIALAGCFIVVSFVVELWAVRQVKAMLAELETETGNAAAQSAVS